MKHVSRISSVHSFRGAGFSKLVLAEWGAPPFIASSQCHRGSCRNVTLRRAASTFSAQRRAQRHKRYPDPRQGWGGHQTGRVACWRTPAVAGVARSWVAESELVPELLDSAEKPCVKAFLFGMQGSLRGKLSTTGFLRGDAPREDRPWYKERLRHELFKKKVCCWSIVLGKAEGDDAFFAYRQVVQCAMSSSSR